MVVVIVRATLTRSDGACGAYAAAPGTAAAPTLKPAAGRADGEIRSVRVSDCRVDSILWGKINPARFSETVSSTRARVERCVRPTRPWRPAVPETPICRLDPPPRGERKKAVLSTVAECPRARAGRWSGPVGALVARGHGLRRDAGGVPIRRGWFAAPRPAPLGGDRSGHARPCAPRDVVDSDDSSWHVSESLTATTRRTTRARWSLSARRVPPAASSATPRTVPPTPTTIGTPDPSRDGTDGTATRTRPSPTATPSTSTAPPPPPPRPPPLPPPTPRVVSSFPAATPRVPPTRPPIVGASRSNASATRDRAAPHP